MKIKFYFMSLWFLFVLNFIITVDVPVEFFEAPKSIHLPSLIYNNLIAIVSALLAVISLFLSFRESYRWSGVLNHVKEIESVKNVNYEYFIFLTTYLIPLLCIDLSGLRYMFVLITLLIFIGVIVVKTNLYYANPTLAILGYKLYRAKIKDADHSEVILISKDALADASRIQWLWIDKDNHIMLAKALT